MKEKVEQLNAFHFSLSEHFQRLGINRVLHPSGIFSGCSRYKNHFGWVQIFTSLVLDVRVQNGEKRENICRLLMTVVLSPIKSGSYVEIVLSTFSLRVTYSLVISYPTGGVG
jgi:hypothetical protein